MADEDGLGQTQLLDDLDQVVRIAGEIGVLIGAVGRKIGTTRADSVEQHGLEPVFKG